jgi:molybdopterin biosynthesis enzyme
MQAAPALPWREVLLAEAVKPNPRRSAFRPACWANERGVIVPSWAGSGDLVHTACTHGIVALPRQDRPVEQGAAVPFLAWPGACAAQGAHV